VWVAPNLDPREVVFLSGAGISSNAPTNGPLGHDLTQRALDHAFLPGVSETIACVYVKRPGFHVGSIMWKPRSPGRLAVYSSSCCSLPETPPLIPATVD